MIRMEVDEIRRPVFVNLTEEHWLFLLSIAKLLYEATGTVQTMTEGEYGRYVVFLLRPVSVNSEKVTASMEDMLQLFQEIIGPHRNLPKVSM